MSALSRSPRAILSAALLALALPAHLVGAQPAYSPEELQKAREFIDKKFDDKKKAMLESLAKRANKTPEEMFLDIGKLTGDATLGEVTPDATDPDAGGDSSEGTPNATDPNDKN